MVRLCIMCKRFQSGDRTLHVFPLNNSRLMQIWKKRLNLHASFNPKKHTRVCSDHFSKKCFKLSKTGRVLLSGSVPEIFPKLKSSCFYCNATECTKPSITLHNFPLNQPELLKLWLENINMKNFVPDKDTLICSDHFEDIWKIQNNCLNLNKDAIPTIFLKETGEDDQELTFEKVVAKNDEENEVIILDEVCNNNDEEILKNSASPSISGEFLSEGNDMTESEDDYNDNYKPTEDIEDPIGCAKCVALQKEIDALRLEKNKIETELREKIHSLESDLKDINTQATNMNMKLGSFFSQRQIEKLQSSTTIPQQRWLEIDIIKSIHLYSVSPEAYKFLKKNNFPLPSVSSLKSWARSIKLTPGVLRPVVQILNTMTDMNKEEKKVCILSFDEMKVATLVPTDFVLVAMLTGLISKWEQPILYAFNRKMNYELLNDILTTVDECGYTIVAVVSDLGGENSRLFNDLKLSPEKPWFMRKDTKIFVFPDVPNLLQLLVKAFFDHGFLINGKEVKKKIVSELLSCTPSDQNTAQETNSDDSDISGVEHKKAAKHFSQSIAKVISRAASLGLLKEANWEECCKLFKLTNDWFDIMNVSTPKPTSEGSILAYGLALRAQNKILNNMSKLMESMRVIGKTTALPFQTGIIHSTVALRLLFEELYQRFGCKCLLTSRLHKDPLDNTLDVLGTMGGLQKLPNPDEFVSRLRCHIIGTNKIAISPDGDDTSVVQGPLTASVFKNIFGPEETICISEGEEEMNEIHSPKLVEESTDMPKAKKTCRKRKRINS